MKFVLRQTYIHDFLRVELMCIDAQLPTIWRASLSTYVSNNDIHTEMERKIDASKV